MRTKDEIERSLAEMKRMADDALRGLAKAQEMEATVLVRHFEIWKAKCEARAQILSWVLDEQELSEDVQPQLPQAGVSGSLPLPTEAEASAYANGAFGYEASADDKEHEFMSGYQWTVDWICFKVGGNDR